MGSGLGISREEEIGNVMYSHDGKSGWLERKMLEKAAGESRGEPGII